MLCQRCRGLLVREASRNGTSSQTLYARPHAASMVGISRMLSFARITSVAWGARLIRPTLRPYGKTSYIQASLYLSWMSPEGRGYE